MKSFTLRTGAQCEMIDITDRVAALVRECVRMIKSPRGKCTPGG